MTLGIYNNSLVYSMDTRTKFVMDLNGISIYGSYASDVIYDTFIQLDTVTRDRAS